MEMAGALEDFESLETQTNLGQSLCQRLRGFNGWALAVDCNAAV